MKAPGIKLLKLKYDKPLSDFAFKFNLRRYIAAEESARAAAEAARADVETALAAERADAKQAAAESRHHEADLEGRLQTAGAELVMLASRTEIQAGAYTRSHFSST